MINLSSDVENCGFIYSITNKNNGRVYIGQTIDAKQRKKYHFDTLKNKNHHNRYLQKDYLRYGGEGFEFCVLEYVSTDSLDEAEKIWIEAYSGKNCYNVSCNSYNINLRTKRNMRLAKKSRELKKMVFDFLNHKKADG